MVKCGRRYAGVIGMKWLLQVCLGGCRFDLQMPM